MFMVNVGYKYTSPMDPMGKFRHWPSFNLDPNRWCTESQRGYPGGLQGTVSKIPKHIYIYPGIPKTIIFNVFPVKTIVLKKDFLI